MFTDPQRPGNAKGLPEMTPCQVLDEQSFGLVLREPERVAGKA
jgi:hypothetical protein